jgi:hypothetical protein
MVTTNCVHKLAKVKVQVPIAVHDSDQLLYVFLGHFLAYTSYDEGIGQT